MKNEMRNKNIAAIGKNHQPLRTALENYKPEQYQDLGVEAETIVIEQREVLFAVTDTQRFQLDSLYHQEDITELWEKTLSNSYETDSKYVFFGIGNGMLVRKLLEHRNAAIQVFVYEPSMLFFHELIEHYDFTDLFRDERFHLVVEQVPGSVYDQIPYFITYSDLKSLYYLVYPNYINLYQAQQNEFRNKLQFICESLDASYDLMAKLGKAHYDNTLANLAPFMQSKSFIKLCEKLPTELPFILVASGPSLDKNVDELKGLKNKAFIVAADSALRVLLKHDIMPDMFVSVDGKKDMRHFSNACVAEIPLLTELTANHRLISGIKAGCYFTKDLNPHIENFLKKHNIPLPLMGSGGSVANNAFSFASYAGFKTLILVGQDLAYTDHKTHSVETVRGERNTDADQLDGFLTEGYDGKPVKTSYVFQLYRIWFEDEIAKHPELNVINATEGGALIKGAVNMPLKEAIGRFCNKTYEMNQVWANIPDLFDEQEKTEFSEYIRQIPAELKEIAGKIRSAIRDYDKLLEMAYTGKLKAGEMKKILERTGNATKLIDQAPSMYYIQTRMQHITNRYLSRTHEAKGDARLEIIDAAKEGKEYLEVVQKVITNCIPEIESKVNLLE